MADPQHGMPIPGWLRINSPEHRRQARIGKADGHLRRPGAFQSFKDFQNGLDTLLGDIDRPPGRRQCEAKARAAVDFPTFRLLVDGSRQRESRLNSSNRRSL
jgi:hypothetical protein